MLVVLLWSTLTVTFLWRLKVIFLNLSHNLVQTGDSLLSLPKISLDPLKQLLVWSTELVLLLVFYAAFGISIVAHMTAAISACAVMFMLRDRRKPFLRSLQLVPDYEMTPHIIDIYAV